MDVRSLGVMAPAKSRTDQAAPSQWSRLSPPTAYRSLGAKPQKSATYVPVGVVTGLNSVPSKWRTTVWPLAQTSLGADAQSAVMSNVPGAGYDCHGESPPPPPQPTAAARKIPIAKCLMMGPSSAETPPF